MSLTSFLGFILTVHIARAIRPDYVTLYNNNIQVDGRRILYNNTREEFTVIAGAVAKICDHIQACLVEPEMTTEFERFVPCCLPCDCYGDECVVRGNCCNGGIVYPTINKFGIPMNRNGESCVPIPTINDMETSIAAVLMVAQCPSDYQESITEQCEDHKPGTHDGLIPVTDKETGITFKNIYCAQCNIYETAALVPWQMYLKCESEIPLTISKLNMYDTVIEHVDEHGCNMIWKTSLPTKECFYKQYGRDCQDSNCQQNGNYKNTILTMTDKIIYDNCLQTYINIPIQVELYDFVILLNIYEGGVTDVSRKGSGMSTQHNDPRCLDVESMDNCVVRVCPPSQLTIINTGVSCIETIASIQGVCLDFRVKVISTQDEVKIDTIVEDLPTLLLSAPFLQDNGVFGKVHSVSRDENKTVHHVAITAYLKHAYNIHALYNTTVSNFDEVADTYVHGIAPDHDKFAFEPLDMYQINFVSYARDITRRHPFSCQQSIAMHKLQFCEMIMFAEDEFVMVENVVVLKNGFSFREYEYLIRPSGFGKTKIQVCLEDYLHKASNDVPGMKDFMKGVGNNPEIPTKLVLLVAAVYMVGIVL